MALHLLSLIPYLACGWMIGIGVYLLGLGIGPSNGSSVADITVRPQAPNPSALLSAGEEP